jgi:CHAT domain-containing protein/Tfp pilus assembly protein PilF
MRRVWLLTLTTGAALFAQGGGERLAPHATSNQSLAPGEERIYRLQVPAGEVAEISVRETQGLAGILLVLDRNGREIEEVDLAKRTPAAQRLLLESGDAGLKLIPANHSQLRRTFEISAGEFRPVVADDSLRVSAEELMGSGEAALRKFEPTYLDDALAKFQKALDLWKRLGDRPRQADVLDHIGYVLHFQGKMKEAIEAYRQALDLAKADGDDRAAIPALFGLAFTNYDTAQYAKTADLAGQALDLAKAADDPRGQSDALSVVGLAAVGKGDTGRAKTSFLAMLDAAQKAGDRVREADAHNDLGLLEFQLGNTQESEQHYTQALAIDRDEKEPVRVAQELSNLGALHASLGNHRDALRYFDEALPIRKLLAQPGSYANTLYNAATSRNGLGEYQQALSGFEEALVIFRRVSHRSGEAYTLEGEATILMWLGESSKAEELLRQSLAIRRSVSDRRGEVITLNVLGNALSRQKQDAAALTTYREALSISHAAGYQREEARASINIGDILVRTGDALSALDLSAKALELSRKVGDRESEADALHLEGNAYRRLKKSELARPALDQALAMERGARAAAFPARTLWDLAKVDIEDGLPQQAAGHMGEALDLVDSMRNNFDSRQSRMEVAATNRSYYEAAIDIEMQLHDFGKAFEISERARARGLVDLIAEAQLDLRQGVDADLLARERQVQELLDAKQNRLTRLLAGNHSAALEASVRGEIDDLLKRYREVETEIRAKSPQYAELTQPRPLSLAEIQAMLPDTKTSLIEFWLGEKQSYGWLVSRADCRGFTLPGRAAVETLARRAYGALNARNEKVDESLAQQEQRIADGRAEFARAAALLSSQLFGPVAQGLAGRRLWIVADGALAYLPFAALPVPGSEIPLVKDHEIVSLPSASVLAVLREPVAGRHSPDRAVAVFADPVFRASDERVSGRKTAAMDDTVIRAATDSGIADLPRLYFSRQEAEAIRKLAPADQILSALDFDASRAAAKKPELDRYRVIHFATHGLLDSRHPELSGIVLSMVDRNGNTQDGFLRLHEIYNLKLNADLVVLSGCQTALGEDVRSEGIIGLTRGFMYAGSPQVLASLWGIRDRATADLMGRFYDGLLRRHLTPAAALRSAQIAMMQDARWSDPYYWAAFTLQGSR